MNNITKCLLLLVVLLASGCASMRANPGELIIGTWQSNLSGFVLTSVYTGTDVSVDGHTPIPYAMDGDKLIVGGDATSARLISFPSKNQMVQRDPLTDVEHTYDRLN